MKSSYEQRIDTRVLEEGWFIQMTECTVRQAAEVFGVSKSTVHLDVSKRLMHLNHMLYEEVKDVMKKNKRERHIRGGEATKRKYQNQ